METSDDNEIPAGLRMLFDRWAEETRPRGGLPERRPSTPALNKALAAAQRRAQAVEKDAQNTFHKYKYASAEAIIAEAREALSAEGLAVFPLSIDRDPTQVDHKWGEGVDKDGKPDQYIDVPRRVLARYLLLHESGEEREFSSSVPVIPEKGRPEDKAEFGSRTENLGYALR
ncbi:MAG TPA: ERF family protein, partial [Methylomirabilota bacterium]|nr:ERF family protein [Methylomirabilota bacterium]